VVVLILDLRDLEMIYQRLIVRSAEQEMQDGMAPDFDVSFIQGSPSGKHEDWSIGGCVKRLDHGTATVEAYSRSEWTESSAKAHGELTLEESSCAVVFLRDSEGQRFAVQFLVIPTGGWERGDWVKSASGWEIRPGAE
jgi:hypothetical protein